MRPTVLLLAAAIQVGATGSFVLKAQSSAPPPALGSSIDFEKDVVPILATHCTSCYGSTRPRGGVSLVFKDAATRGCGTLDPGRYINYDGLVMSNLWLSLMDRMGVVVERHGDSTGRLPALSV